MNYVRCLSFLSFLVISVFMMSPISAYAKTITTKFFEITVPERFTHIEGCGQETSGLCGGTTEGTNPLGDQVRTGGASFIIEFGILENEQEFLDMVEESKEDSDLDSDVIPITQTMHEDTSSITSHYTFFNGEAFTDMPYYVHSYLMF